MSLAYFWSKSFLTSRWMLWSLFWVNFLGTIYGYIWYGGQLEYTFSNNPLWQIIFVPDSPTASLFFTVSILYLLYRKDEPSGKKSIFRGLMEALAVVTSVKYGIWAVVMIFAETAQGDTLVWQDWMLVISHTGMAVEALLFARFFSYGYLLTGVAAIWTISNDFVDYHFGVFPALSAELLDDLPQVELFTVLLSVFSIACAYSAIWLTRRTKV